MDNLLFGEVGMTFGQVEHNLYVPDAQMPLEVITIVIYHRHRI